MKIKIRESDLHEWFMTKRGPVKITQVYSDYCVFKNKSGTYWGSSWDNTLEVISLKGTLWKRVSDQNIIKVGNIYSVADKVWQATVYVHDKRYVERVDQEYLFNCQYIGS